MSQGSTMKDNEFDRILSQEEEILPSSGFTASVMEAVQREAVAPQPIPFPWKRALPGLAAAGFALLFVLIELVMYLASGAAAPQVSISLPLALQPILQLAMNAGAGWVVLALFASLVSAKLSMRLASGRAWK